MRYQVRASKHFARQLIAWNLPAEVRIELRLRLDDLEPAPSTFLDRVTHPFDGMAYTFPVVDRSNRVYGYAFTLHIRYGTDETTLWVMRGGYMRFPL